MTQEKLFEEDSQNVSVHENPALKAKVIGVGGAGLSLADGLRLDNFRGVEQLVIDVDARALADSIAAEKMAIGRTLTRGMGTGGESALARKAIGEEKDNIRKALEGVDIVFLLAGLGGGTVAEQPPKLLSLPVKRVLLFLRSPPCLSVGKKVGTHKPKIHSPNLGSLRMR